MKPILPPSPVLLLTAALLLPRAVPAQSTFTAGDDHYAWNANTGWIDFFPQRPGPGDGVQVTDTHFSGFAWSANTGWINFGDGAPANRIRYANTDGADSGVNHDGAGNLSGLAWSANLGWINFGWAVPEDPDRPRFEILTGDFRGYAWSANAGWINLQTGILRTETMVVTDTDGDRISDAWELELAGDLETLRDSRDSDGDGFSDLAEYLADTDPLDGGDRFRIIDLALEPSGTRVTWISRPTRLYRVHHCGDLQSWSPSLLGLIMPETGPSTQRLVPHPTTPRQFFRVESIVPLQP